MKYEYVGVDIGKHTCDVYFQGKSWSVKQTEVAIKKDLIQKIEKLTQSLDNIVIVCEASGGYERLLSSILAKENIKFHIAHAQFIKAYAQSYGLKAKTDKIDAKNIATFAAERDVVPDVVLSENKQKIADLLKRREQLLHDKVREKKRLDKHQNKDVEASVRKHIDWIEGEMKAIDKVLDGISKSDESIQKAMTLLMSTPGIGRIIALHIIAFLPELGQISNKEATALVGLAPYNHDSGLYRGKRFIKGGRSRIRGLFYMSAVVNIKCNVELQEFYQRLKEKGKPTRVALIAVARKIVSTLNSVATRGTPWVNKEQFACQI